MGEILDAITCSASECLCWILVLMNIMAIFYLVFCSFCRVNKVVKIIGWVWLTEMLTSTVALLVIHTCLYTMLATVFTTMIMMAMLFVILPENNKKDEEKEQKEPKLGSYVISKTDDSRFVFAIYDSAKKLVAKSACSYLTVDEVRNAIGICKDNGMLAAVRGSSGSWVKESNYPNFEVYVRNGKYYSKLNINEEYAMLNSVEYSDMKKCIKNLQKVRVLVASTNVYFNTEREPGNNYIHFGEVEQPVEEKHEVVEATPVVEEVKPEPVVQPVEPEPIVEAIEPAVEETPAVEEVVEPAVEIPEEDLFVEETGNELFVSQEEQPVVEDDKNNFDFNTMSFEEKLKLASSEVKERYEELRNELINLGAKSRISYSADTLKIGKETVAKFGIKRTTLSLYLALDPNEYLETKYSFTDVSDVKKYEQVPMKLKLKSARSVKWAKELIEQMIEKLGLKNN